jgi:anti-anti-sigma factor
MGVLNTDVCEVEFRGDAALVRIRGSLDAGCAHRVERVLRRVGAAGLSRVVIDLRELYGLDEEGIDVLVETLGRAERDGVELALVQRDGVVHRAGAVPAVC